MAQGELCCGGGSDSNKMETLPSEEEAEGPVAAWSYKLVFMEQLHDVGGQEGTPETSSMMEELLRNCEVLRKHWTAFGFRAFISIEA